MYANMVCMWYGYASALGVSILVVLFSADQVTIYMTMTMMLLVENSSSCWVLSIKSFHYVNLAVDIVKCIWSTYGCWWIGLQRKYWELAVLEQFKPRLVKRYCSFCGWSTDNKALFVPVGLEAANFSGSGQILIASKSQP